MGHGDPDRFVVFCLVAGEVAEAIHADRHWNHVAPDVRDALAIAAVASDGDGDEVWTLVTWEPETWGKTEAVADVLVERGMLTPEELLNLIKG